MSMLFAVSFVFLVCCSLCCTALSLLCMHAEGWSLIVFIKPYDGHIVCALAVELCSSVLARTAHFRSTHLRCVFNNHSRIHRRCY